MKCHKILTDLSSPIPTHYHPKYTINTATLALVSNFCSSVARALRRYREAAGSIPAKGPIVGEFFSIVRDLSLSCI